MEYVKIFPCGLKLIVKQIDGLLSVTTGILVGAGSGNESQKENGISHFLEHMMFKGTKKRTAFEISESIDKIGAQINAFTTKEITCYYTKSTVEHTAEAVEILSDLFLHSTFDEKELERERGVVLEEIAMCEDTPEDLCLDLLGEAHFGARGLGATILGPCDNIRAFAGDDLRGYMDKRYTADNIVIAMAGNIKIEDAEKIVGELFVGAFQDRLKKQSGDVPVSGGKGGKLFREKEIEQTHIALGFPTYALDDPRGTALSLVNIALGGGMSSRLFQTVREKLGYCYSVYSYASAYQREGLISVYAAVNPQNKQKALDAIVKEIEGVKNGGITTEEFLRGKEQMKGAFVFGQESTSSQMLLYGKYLLLKGKVFDFERRIGEINDVTEQDVRRVIDENFDFEKVALAAVGRKGVEKLTI